MPPESFSINKLGEMLERDRRTIARALSDIPPDDRDAQGNGRWRIATAVRALAARAGISDSSDATLAELEQVAGDVESLLEQLRAAGGAEAARKILRDGGGRCVGRLDHLMESAASDRRPAERALLDQLRNHIIGHVLGEVLELANWQDVVLTEPASTSGGQA